MKEITLQDVRNAYKSGLENGIKIGTVHMQELSNKKETFIGAIMEKFDSTMEQGLKDLNVE